MASDLAVDGGGMKFRVSHKGKPFGDFALAASGRHNVLNAHGSDRRGKRARELARKI